MRICLYKYLSNAFKHEKAWVFLSTLGKCIPIDHRFPNNVRQFFREDENLYILIIRLHSNPSVQHTTRNTPDKITISLPRL